jgi:hypothetical protein
MMSRWNSFSAMSQVLKVIQDPFNAGSSAARVQPKDTIAGYLTRSGAELVEKLFDELRLLLNDTDTIRSVSTVKLA